MTAHDHATLVDGCYRCELNRDEVEADEVMRAAVSHLWAEHWDSPEDAVYDGEAGQPDKNAGEGTGLVGCQVPTSPASPTTPIGDAS